MEMTDRQTDKTIDRQTDRRIERLTQADKQIDKHIVKRIKGATRHIPERLRDCPKTGSLVGGGTSLIGVPSW